MTVINKQKTERNSTTILTTMDNLKIPRTGLHQMYIQLPSSPTLQDFWNTEPHLYSIGSVHSQTPSAMDTRISSRNTEFPDGISASNKTRAARSLSCIGSYKRQRALRSNGPPRRAVPQKDITGGRDRPHIRPTRGTSRPIAIVYCAARRANSQFRAQRAKEIDAERASIEPIFRGAQQALDAAARCISNERSMRSFGKISVLGAFFSVLLANSETGRNADRA